MPFVAKQVRSGSVADWHVREGDHIDFGTDLCDVLITEVDRIDKSQSERRLVPVPVRYRVRIRASESGILRLICATEGFDVSVGDLLGVVSTDPDEPVDGPPPAGAPALRVVADTTNPGDD